MSTLSLSLLTHTKNHYSTSLINIFLLNKKKLNLNKTDEVSFLDFHTYIYMQENLIS